MSEVKTWWKKSTGIFLFYLTSLAIVTSLATDSCPKTCLCRGDILTCSPDTNDGVKLQRVPLNFLQYNLLHIRNVNLSHNGIQQLEPGDFFGLSQTQHLDLGHNRVRALIRNGFDGLDSALTIKLSHNLIRYIDRFAFDGLNNIRKIDLSHNEIAFIEDAPFRTVQGLGGLHLLDLSFNQIHIVDDVIFLGLESLQELYLNHNLINKVGISAFMLLRSLRMLYLADNPIKCSCSWFEVWDFLQSRDIEIMDTSDAINCNFNDETNCRTLSLIGNVSQESPQIGATNLTVDDQIRTSKIEPNHERVAINLTADDQIRTSKKEPNHERVATNLTVGDLRPPDTDGHGNIVSGLDSFPLQSPEGERILSEYDVAMRQRIEAIRDKGKKRLYSLVFQERMRKFITALQREEGSLSTVTRRSTTISGNEIDIDNGEIVFDGYEKDKRNVTPTTTQSELGKPFQIMASQLERTLEQLFPQSLFNFSEVVRLTLGVPKSPERLRFINRLVTGDVDALRKESELVMKKMANVSEWSVATTPKTTTKVIDLILMTRKLPTNTTLKHHGIVIPVITVIGIFAFVCIAALAIAMLSGQCSTANDNSCCSCRWVATIQEKLMLRKLQMERQSRKTTSAKSDFLKLHCQARHSIISRLSSTPSPSVETSLQQPGKGDRGVVSITPLVLTDDFPNRSKAPLGNKANYESHSSYSSPDMYKDIKNCLSPATDGKETIGDCSGRNHTPQDEITLFEVPLSRSTSDHYNDREQQVHDSTSSNCTPNVDEICQSKETTSTLESVTPAVDVEKSSSELRWFARECLSNQRMMVQGRTPSMTSSDDILGVADVKKGENGN